MVRKFVYNVVNWASEASHTGVILRDIYCMYNMSVCLSCAKMRRLNYVAQTRACSKSVLGG